MNSRTTTLEVDEYDPSNRLVTTPHADPAWERVEAAISALTRRDRRYAGVRLVRADGSFLMLDGSGGRFTALVETADGAQHQFFDPSRPETEVEVVIGGVVTPFPERYMCDRATISRVARRFYDDGALDAGVEWEQT